ncbi:AraC family transcriptional regulator [Sporolactobacillus sp. CQH2019]|uniref:AraC family transcriptional regulator n=1 Tax=Sporolactobacillus sp. CQH2019 TaxID=3023512 RepID=UPI002367F928|nr:AraC family transcriptional regulator [Sporolactobacillus sp. CQH2019]MDD9149809.1 AraC family transcriptional regulator [Sporolactobacillus sp. CQH2019]
MIKSEANHYSKPKPDVHPYVDIQKRVHLGSGPTFKENWHEEFQLYYLTSGTGLLRCDSEQMDMCPGDVALINSNELHVLESRSSSLSCYVIRIDPAAMFSLMPGLSTLKFAVLLSQQLVCFSHLVRGDRQIQSCIRSLIQEDEERRGGFELAVQSSVLELFVLLLRSYVSKIYTKKRFDTRMNSLSRLKSVILYMNEHYQKSLTVAELAGRALMSESHFCRTFKKIYGKTVVNYINSLRIDKAGELLKNSPLNITEIALAVGFNDANYFSRVFKRQKGITPQMMRTQIASGRSKQTS